MGVLLQSSWGVAQIKKSLWNLKKLDVDHSSKMDQLVIWMVSEKLLGKCGDGRLKLEIGVLVVLVLAFGDD